MGGSLRAAVGLLVGGMLLATLLRVQVLPAPAGHTVGSKASSHDAAMLAIERSMRTAPPTPPPTPLPTPPPTAVPTQQTTTAATAAAPKPSPAAPAASAGAQGVDFEERVESEQKACWSSKSVEHNAEQNNTLVSLHRVARTWNNKRTSGPPRSCAVSTIRIRYVLIWAIWLTAPQLEQAVSYCATATKVAPSIISCLLCLNGPVLRNT